MVWSLDLGEEEMRVPLCRIPFAAKDCVQRTAGNFYPSTSTTI